MALFPNVTRDMSFRGKSHTNLVVSEGMAPSEHFIISRTNTAEPFIYEYGEIGNQTCVLAKGKIVEIAGTEFEADTSHYKTAVRQATDNSEKAIGVNFHNVYARRRDGLHSTITKPTVITRNYIEVPLFETEGAADITGAQGYANAMKFGAAVSNVGVVGEVQQITAGDYVVSDAFGNFRKYDKAVDDAKAIVGQVLAKETELPPAGFLQYYSEIINPEMEQYLKLLAQSVPSPGASNGTGFTGGYPYGAPHTIKGWKPEFEKMLAGAKLTGIPYLTDGFYRAQELVDVTGLNTADVEAVRVTDACTYDDATGIITVKANTRNAAVFIKLKNKMDMTKASSISVKVGANVVNAQDLHIDFMNNTIVVYLQENMTSSDVALGAVTMSVPSIVDPVAGIPSEWDYKNSVGAIRILLQK